MSHAEIIQKNYDVLLRCTTVNYYVIDFLKGENVLDRIQEAELKETNNSVKQRVLLFQWLQELPYEKYDTFLQVMNNTEQEHVTNLLRGRTEEGHLPLLNTRHDRLEKNRHKIAHAVRTDSELVAELRKSTAISRIDADEIRAAKGEYKKSSKLISSIMRRSNQCYNNFQDALRRTLQTTAAEFLNEGEMPAVHLNNNRPDLDESLSFTFNETIRNNPGGDTRIKELITELNGYGLHLVKAIPGQSIVIFIYCKTVQSAVKFTQLFNSGMLQYLLDSIFNRLLLTIEPRNTSELNSLISLEDEEIETLEEFTGMEGWKTQRLGRLQYFRKKSERDATTQADDNVAKRKITDLKKRYLDLKATSTPNVKGKALVIKTQKGLQKQTEKFRLQQHIVKLQREIYQLKKKQQKQHAGLSAAPTKNRAVPTLQTKPLELSLLVDLKQGKSLEQRSMLRYQTIRRAQMESIRVNSASSYGRDAKYPRREESGSAPSYQVDCKNQKCVLPRGEYRRAQNLSELPVKCLKTIFLKTSALQKGHREAHHQNLASVCTKWRNIVAVMNYKYCDTRLIKGNMFSKLENLMVEGSKGKKQTRDFRTTDKLFAPPRQPNLLWSKPSFLLSSLYSGGGFFEELSDNYTYRKSGQLESTVLELPVNFRSDPVLVQTIKTNDEEERNKSIRGMVILDKELFVVSELSSEVEVYDSVKFIFNRRWNLRDLVNPQDIGSCNRNKCLYIFDSKVIDQSNEIMRVDPKGKLINFWSTGDNYEWSLSVTDESNVVLALCTKNKLSEYSPDGRLIREINLSTDAGKIRSPRQAIKLTNGNFVVSHGSGYLDPHKVSIVDTNGKLQKSFEGTLGSTIGHMSCPVYLSVDGSGFVMVADHDNSRVLLLGPELEFRKELLSKEKNGLRSPQRILLDELNGKLFVADNDGRGGLIFIFGLQTQHNNEDSPYTICG